MNLNPFSNQPYRKEKVWYPENFVFTLIIRDLISSSLQILFIVEV